MPTTAGGGIPSGHVEPGETVQHAAEREVQEETALQVIATRMVGVYSDPASQTVNYPDGRICQYVTTAFVCSIQGGDLRPDGIEALEADFFAADQLPAPLMPMHPQWLNDALSGRTGVAR